MNKTKKINVAVVFGGRSGEYEVSLNSAYNVISAIDRNTYDITMLGIKKDGKWAHYTGSPEKIPNNEWVEEVDVFGHNLDVLASGILDDIDIFFPVLHGTFGEDGTIQGLFEMMNVPYVGCGVLASAAAMDKAIAKQLFTAAGVDTCRFVCASKAEILADIEKVIKHSADTLSYPMFVKPANMGSSVGISKAGDAVAMRAALLEAIKYDNKVIIEECVIGQEVETAVLGNDEPICSCVGEVIPANEFYDYDAKYLMGDESKILIPAPLPEEISEKVRAAALAAYRAIGAGGLARCDFFVTEDSRVLINEINTLPGFTDISMYPKLWAESGISYAELVNRLIELGFERANNRAALQFEKK